MRRALVLMLLLSPVIAWGDDDSHFYLVIYSPGRDWVEKAGFEDQPRMAAHVQYLTQLHQEDILLMEGSLSGEQGAAMLILAGSLSRAQEIAADDPAVASGVLKATVNEWHVRMSSMRHFKRVVPEVQPPNEPFKVERLDPRAPINLKAGEPK